MAEVRYIKFSEYFNKLLEENEPKKRQDEIADRFGVKQGTISRIKNGTMLPGEDLAEKFAKEWGVPDFMEHVYTARREEGAKFFREAKQREENELADVAEVKTKPRLPVTAAAGHLSDYLEGVRADECEYLPVMRSLPDYDFTMLIKGNSMEPKFEGGDEIACKKVTSIIEPGKTYVLATRDGAVVKRLYPENNGVRCVSYNHEEYPDFFVNGEDVLDVYRVVGLIRV